MWDIRRYVNDISLIARTLQVTKVLRESPMLLLVGLLSLRAVFLRVRHRQVRMLRLSERKKAKETNADEHP